MNTKQTRFWAKIGKGMFAASLAVLLAACGSGGGGSPQANAVATAACDPDDPASFAECGSVLLALTDADGDFLNYTVDVVSLQLETANGRIVETLPRNTRVNFTDYVELSELVTVANVPPATYVAGRIRLDYSAAEIFVEADGVARETVVTDQDGNILLQTDLRILLSNRDRLTVVKGRPSLLQLDFDLEASHSVDIGPTPAVATAEAFIVAEVAPLDEKELRVRGPLVDVSIDSMTYTVALRPFYDRHGDFGRLDVRVEDATLFEVNELPYTGADGLLALDAAGSESPTVAWGILDVDERRFTAHTVLAGSSVPGSDRDAVKGNVIARDGNLLTVRGATIIATDRLPHFHDEVIVEIGPDTKVSKHGADAGKLGIEAISVGQRVTVHGEIAETVTDFETPAIHIDASKGAVRLHVTHLLGIVNTVMPGQTDITLHGIDRRRIELFDFSGTGTEAANDADPMNYEVATGDLVLADFAAGKPMVAYGFPSEFGSAPPDFDGRTVIDFTDVRSSLGIGWGPAGTIAPFSSISSDSLILTNMNNDIGHRHHIRNGPVLIDLKALDSDTTVIPSDSRRVLFFIKTGDSLRQYSDFADFTDDLAMSLDGATAARSLHAHGHFDAVGNRFIAHKIGVYLQEP